jgi:hypothetical protein
VQQQAMPAAFFPVVEPQFFIRIPATVAHPGTAVIG